MKTLFVFNTIMSAIESIICFCHGNIDAGMGWGVAFLYSLLITLELLEEDGII